jgi:hypothetical protein
MSDSAPAVFYRTIPVDTEILTPDRPTARRSSIEQRMQQLADQQWRILKEIQENEAAAKARAQESAKWESRVFAIIGIAGVIIGLLVAYIFYLLSTRP